MSPLPGLTAMVSEIHIFRHLHGSGTTIESLRPMSTSMETHTRIYDRIFRKNPILQGRLVFGPQS
jgi:hypothetical protein